MTAPATPIGIVAGSGALPVEAARAISGRGGRVHVAMVDGLADGSLAEYPHTVVNWAQVGRTISAFRAAGVRDVIMLGATGRPKFREARPDLGFLKALPSILKFLNAGGDDAVLRGLIALFERNGLAVRSAADVVPELLVAAGTMTTQEPAKSETDIATGFGIIRALGRYDIGQGVVVRDGKVLAIEGAEGTDRMLQHVATLPSGGQRGGVLVKRPKPGQDLRVDLPTIGSNTVRNARAANLAGIAAMADHVLAAEREEMIACANASGLFIVGRGDPVLETVSEISDRPQLRLEPASTTKRLPDSDLDDLTKAASIVTTLGRQGIAANAVVIDKRVIAVGVDEVATATVKRASLIRRPRRRRGVVVIGATSGFDEDTLQAVADSNLRAIVTTAPTVETQSTRIIALAEKLGVSVATMEAQDR